MCESTAPASIRALSVRAGVLSHSAGFEERTAPNIDHTYRQRDRERGREGERERQREGGRERKTERGRERQREGREGGREGQRQRQMTVEEWAKLREIYSAE